MSDDTTTSRVAEICLFEDALPERLFQRLVRAVRSVGNERMKDNGSYNTTFWFPRNTDPRNIAEAAIVELLKQVEPGPECIGTEWWLGRLGPGKKLNFHFDRDLALKRKTGESIHPIFSSVLYLNASSSPTVIVDQVLAADGKSRIPEEPEYGKSVEAVPNHYVVFSGNLRHGVVPSADASEKERKSSERRLTLLVNYWNRRPLPPVCCDYDGTIYAKLQDQEFGATE